MHANNLLQIFYEQASVDSYIAENLYGGYGEESTYAMPNYAQRYMSLKYFNLEQMTYLAPHLGAKKTRNGKPERLLTPFEVYVALVKGYCVILVLVLPRSFATGGYLCTAGLVLLSGAISTLCASLLV